MKKLLLSIAFLTSFSGFSQILSEGFESATFPPEGWTSSTLLPIRPWNLVTNIFAASSLPAFIITGTNSAGIGWYAANNVADLTSPEFSLSGYTAATFSFNVRLGYVWMVTNPNGNLLAQISTDGTSWTTLWVEENQGVYADFETLAVSLDLAAYLNESTVKIRFVYNANDADALSLDDVVVSGTLGTNDFISAKFKVFPNPANNFITISNDENVAFTSATITDVNGRIMKQVDYKNVSETKIDIDHLSSGVYFLTVATDSGNAVKKFIKN